MRASKSWLAFGVVAGAVVWSLSLYAQRVVGALPSSVTDLSTAQTVEIRDANGTAILKGTFVKDSEEDDDDELTAVLTSVSGTGEGKAEIEVEKSANGPAAQEIEVAVKHLQPNTTFKLYVDDSEVATFVTSRKGDVSLKYTSKRSGK